MLPHIYCFVYSKNCLWIRSIIIFHTVLKRKIQVRPFFCYWADDWSKVQELRTLIWQTAKQCVCFFTYLVLFLKFKNMEKAYKTVFNNIELITEWDIGTET